MAATKKTKVKKPIVRPFRLSYRTWDGNKLEMSSPDASLEDIDTAIKLLNILRASYVNRGDGVDVASTKTGE